MPADGFGANPCGLSQSARKTQNLRFFLDFPLLRNQRITSVRQGLSSSGLARRLMGVGLLMILRSVFYLFTALGLATLGADLLRGLEDGRVVLRSVADLWAASNLPGLAYADSVIDPNAWILGQSAALVVLVLAATIGLFARQGARRRRRIFK